ncbi:MAG: 5-oxoprolinase subunit PxpB [Betaproteobacteria bacterium]|nr:5-oxoprolinase subunit PxpB [Betaproteobacteria bacterium]
MPGANIVAMGESAVVVEFGRTVNRETNARARALGDYLRANPLPGVTDVVPAYAAVTVHFDTRETAGLLRVDNPLEAMKAAIEALLPRVPAVPRRKPRVLEIPVCYGGEHGPDLERVAAHCRLPAEEVVARHCAPLYDVYFLGFVPGFGYLGTLDRRLHTPRLDTPRKRIPAGSVGIGGEQTGVYPMESPGGWNLIGRTPRRLFRLDADGAPNVMDAGDQVRFVPVPAAEYDRLKATQR